MRKFFSLGVTGLVLAVMSMPLSVMTSDDESTFVYDDSGGSPTLIPINNDVFIESEILVGLHAVAGIVDTPAPHETTIAYSPLTLDIPEGGDAPVSGTEPVAVHI